MASRPIPNRHQAALDRRDGRPSRALGKDPFQGSLKQLLALLVESFPGILADL